MATRQWGKALHESCWFSVSQYQLGGVGNFKGDCCDMILNFNKNIADKPQLFAFKEKKVRF